MTSRTFALSRQRRRRTGQPRTAGAIPEVTGQGAPAPRLPHERDQYVDPPAPPRRTIVQAERDLAEGKVDTDLRSDAAPLFERATLRRPRQR